ncbi:MAG: PEP-CTERM sorting domain-containing protein [Burkholderiales bacterium]|nr:PEP-CTERM sorting domain-containing protein [Burkholderiales bacterium]
MFPIDVSFFDTANTANEAVTDFVSLRGDLWGGGSGPISLFAYDIAGNLLTSDTQPDVGGTTLVVSAAGIHRVRFIGNGSVGVDDLTFNALVAAVPEPHTIALIAVALSAMTLALRRKV